MTFCGGVFFPVCGIQFTPTLILCAFCIGTNRIDYLDSDHTTLPLQQGPTDFCSDPLAALLTPNSWTLCGGVIELGHWHTLYNSAFCSGATRTGRAPSTSTPHLQPHWNLCGGHIAFDSLDTQCQSAFCCGATSHETRSCISELHLQTPINWTLCGGVTDFGFDLIFQGTLYNKAFCSGATQTRQESCDSAILLNTLTNWDLCGRVTVFDFLGTLYNKAFCSGAIQNGRAPCGGAVQINTPNSWTLCGGVTDFELSTTLYNKAFCSGATQNRRGSCDSAILINTLNNWNLCGWVIEFDFQGTLYNKAFCSGATQNGRAPCGGASQINTPNSWTLCGGVTDFKFLTTLYNQAFRSGAIYKLRVNPCRVLLLLRCVIFGSGTLIEPTLDHTLRGVDTGIQHWILQQTLILCGVIYWLCCCLSFGSICNCSSPDRHTTHFDTRVRVLLQRLQLTVRHCWTYSLPGARLCLTGGITLCHWIVSGGIIFWASTPYNWTFCGGVISIFTLYNWAFCSGAKFSPSFQHHSNFCSGALIILTLSNQAFCSGVDHIGFQTLRWAFYLNLLLAGSGQSKKQDICKFIATYIRGGALDRFSLNFPELQLDLITFGLATFYWHFHFSNSILIWRLQQLGLHLIWLVLQLWKHKWAARFLSYFKTHCWHEPSLCTWAQLFGRHLSVANILSFRCRSGPKSRRPFGKLSLGLSCLGLLMVLHQLDRGEGCDSVMRITEASVDLPWVSHIPHIADAKQHDMRPQACSASQSRSPTTVTKRSLKRAQRRAHQHGIAWYKGRLYRPEDFHFMPPLDPVQVPAVAQTSADKAQLDKCNRLHGTKRRVTCMQWNVGGLSSHRLDELKSWLSTQHVQILTLIETRWSYTGEWLDPDWIHIHSGLQGSKSTGILTLISRKFCSERDIRWQEVDAGRLVHIRIPMTGRSMDLICGYQHVDTRSAACLQKRESWWAKLDLLLQGIPQRNMLLAMADFNCNIPECSSYSGSEWYRWGSTLTKGSQHSDAGRFLSLLRYHGLVILNSWDASAGPTYVHGTNTSRIDYACVWKTHVDGISKQPKYLWQAPFMNPTKNGHVPIMHQIALYWANSRSMKPTGITKQQEQQAKLAMQSNTTPWMDYLDASADVLRQSLNRVLTSESPACLNLNELHSEVNACFHSFFPPMSATKPKMPWKQTQHLILNKWQHRNIMLNIRTCTGSGVFRAWFHLTKFTRLKREHRRHAAQVRHANFCDVVQAAQDAAQKHDMHKMFSLINRHAPKVARRRIQIRNAAGSIASPCEELKILQDFVQDIWGGPPQIPISFSQAPGVPFTVSELANALSRIPLNRAVAHPFAPGIAWRFHSHMMAPILHRILSGWWSTTPPYVPPCWKDGWMILLGKPQKPPTTPYNLRPIALQDPVGKAIVGLLIQYACADATHQMQPWPLWAYLPRRSTLDAVCRVAQHCIAVQHLIASQKPTPHARAAGAPTYPFCGGVSIMLDLERAFDSVSRTKLFGQLHMLDIRSSVIQLLTEWHCDTHYHFQHGQDTHAMPTGTGLRQGCKAAPGLWNFLILLYLKRVATEIPLTWLRSHLNIYADDYQVGGTFYSTADLTLLLRAFGVLLELLQEFSLCINTKKSVALLAVGGTSHRSARDQFVEKKQDQEQLRIPLPSGEFALIPIQSKTKYLGTVMTYKDCAHATLQHRLTLARIAHRRLGRWFRGKHALSIRHRIQLWRTTVFPVLTYGLFATGISDIGIKQLQRAMIPMLRQATCDHAYRTGHSNQQVFSRYRIPTPLQQLRAAAEQLLQSITQRRVSLPIDDIALQLPWDHLDQTIQRLHAAQELSTQPVEPAPFSYEPSDRQMHQCDQCEFFTHDVTVFRRHCTTAHGSRILRKHFAIASQFTTHGLPECKFCHHTFSTWRSFQQHIDRGCQALYSGPCAADAYTVEGASIYMAGTLSAAGEIAVRGPAMLPENELANLRSAPFGTALCDIVDKREWHRLAHEYAACQYMSTRCILCGLFFNRIQDLNAHFRQMHGQYWEGVPQRATLMSNTWATERPCPYCGALFKAHLCPVWVQVTVLLLFGVGPNTEIAATPEDPPRHLRCEICLDTFDDVPTLTEHMRTAHHLQGLSFNLARDSVAGEPGCAHCGTLYDNMASLRSHIVQGRCAAFSPDAVAENLPMDEAWLQACTGGQMMALLQESRQRMRLSLHCQLCGARYSRSSDLSNHLQGSHPRVWRLSQQLTMILVHRIYSQGTCVCNPSLHVNRLGHICLPLRQLSMLYHMMDDRIFAPFPTSEESLARMIPSNLPRPFRFQLEQILTYRCFEKLWQDFGCMQTMRHRCVFCGQVHEASTMCQHLREAHPCTRLAFSFYMSQIAPLMLARQIVDHRCIACNQIYNLPMADDMSPDPDRQKLVQSHLLHNCPNLLQVVLLLTGLLHDGRLSDDSSGSLCTA